MTLTEKCGSKGCRKNSKYFVGTHRHCYVIYVIFVATFGAHGQGPMATLARATVRTPECQGIRMRRPVMECASWGGSELRNSLPVSQPWSPGKWKCISSACVACLAYFALLASRIPDIRLYIAHSIRRAWPTGLLIRCMCGTRRPGIGEQAKSLRKLLPKRWRSAKLRIRRVSQGLNASKKFQNGAAS